MTVSSAGLGQQVSSCRIAILTTDVIYCSEIRGGEGQGLAPTTVSNWKGIATSFRSQSWTIAHQISITAYGHSISTLTIPGTFESEKSSSISRPWRTTELTTSREGLNVPTKVYIPWTPTAYKRLGPRFPCPNRRDHTPIHQKINITLPPLHISHYTLWLINLK